MESNLAEFGGISGVTLIVMQLVKQYIPGKYRPLVAVGIALVLSSFYGLSQGKDITVSAIEGIVAGLMASGLYDQKNLVKKS